MTSTARRTTAAAIAAAFLLCVVGANYLTEHHGMVPVGFGLTATAGTYAAGATFLLRDMLQETGGRRLVLALVIAGAALSYAVSSPQLAIASGVAFLTSELGDYGVYSRLRDRGWARAALASNAAGAAIDTWLFLAIAGFPIDRYTVAGQLVGKLLITSIAIGGARALLRPAQRPASA